MTDLERSDISVPKSKLAKEIAELIRDSEDDLLFHHSSRVYLFGAMTGERRGLKFDPELLYAGAMFHDYGLTPRFKESKLRFEVDSANAARQFLRSRGIPGKDVETVWTAIALHTTPGVPEHMRAEIALVNAGVAMDVLGFAYDDFSDAQRRAVLDAHPRGPEFKHEIIDAFYEGMRSRPDSTFGTMNDDVLAFKDPDFRRADFCSIILNSKWAG